jgi:Fe-S oxidoreductase
MKTLLLAPPEKFMMNPRTGCEDMLRPKTWVPLGIAYLASSLRAAGHTAETRDLHDVTWLKVSKLLRALAPDVVGITCFTMNRANALRLASLVKKELPASVVIMGGPHATFFPEQILQNPAVDIVALGQGEETIVEVIAALQVDGDLRQIQGLVFRKGEELVRTRRGNKLPLWIRFLFPTTILLTWMNTSLRKSPRNTSN